jgi:hypothetical protein
MDGYADDLAAVIEGTRPQGRHAGGTLYRTRRRKWGYREILTASRLVVPNPFGIRSGTHQRLERGDFA